MLRLTWNRQKTRYPTTGCQFIVDSLLGVCQNEGTKNLIKIQNLIMMFNIDLRQFVITLPVFIVIPFRFISIDFVAVPTILFHKQDYS